MVPWTSRCLLYLLCFRGSFILRGQEEGGWGGGGSGDGDIGDGDGHVLEPPVMISIMITLI